MIYANGHFCKRDSNSDRADANSSLKNICPSDKSSEAHRNSLVSDDRIHAIPIVIRYSRTSQTNSAAVRRYLLFDGHLLSLRTTQVLSRFPTQNRRDKARQQSSAGTARPYKHRAQAVTTTAQRPENWEQSNLPAPRKKSGRCPTRFRRDQVRQQLSAGTARRVSNCQRAPPAQT